MATCSTCGAESPEGFKFCGNCGAPLSAEAKRPIAEERKVVTSLFCDLVGFTATSESADPEDVDRMLNAYFSVARNQIEGHGGVVEKFIGDAVVGVFGVPVVHEDDPERAVRAGLRIIEDAERLEGVAGAPLRLRVGINTGEALVRLGVSTASGEGFLAGDTINTASRIQSVAPEMGVAVGLATYEATAALFDYEELEAATLKGKAEPVRIFHARSPLSQVADLSREHDAPLIGREIDLALLKGIFAKAVAAESPQLVMLVGEPGIGKSRLVAELYRYIDDEPYLINWRQGRCLPYGEGITFWALGEIVKAQAGILESDGPEAATAKLDLVLPEGEERGWFRQRLLPLLGIEASAPAEREELYTAWRRYLEHIAEGRPTVLIFEDLHWADDALLLFLEQLTDRAEGVPLIVVGTARPELYERRRDFAAGLANANRINLGPLSEPETTRLVAALLETTVLPAALQQPVLDRAGGNPLYAEEFVRLLKDRGLLVRKGSSWDLREDADVPLPDSVQALIAARLDTLPADTKSLLADAAVIGRVFWAGAVAEMGDRNVDGVVATLRELSRKELVRPSRRSSLEGEAEYAFWHVLARDVAYAQLPRAARASRHVAAARWIESKAPQRVEDLADVLAYHYVTALDLARAGGHDDDATELQEPALRFLAMAGERAIGLDTTAAMNHLEAALKLLSEDHPGRGHALSLFGEAALHAGRYGEAAAALEEAIAAFRSAGETGAAASAMNTLSNVAQTLGEPRAWSLASEALELLEPLGPSAELVAVLTEIAANEALQGEYAAAIRDANRAVDLAQDLGLARPARALGYLALALAERGDPSAIERFEEAIALASEAGQGREVALLHNNFGVTLVNFRGPAAALEILHEGTRFAEGIGNTELTDGLDASIAFTVIDAGRPGEAITLASSMEERLATIGDVFDLHACRSARIRALALMGRAAEASDVLDPVEARARAAEDTNAIAAGLGAVALARSALGQPGAAIALLDELASAQNMKKDVYYLMMLPAFVREAIRLGEAALAESLASGPDLISPLSQHARVAASAIIAEARGDLEDAAETYADAAERWERFTVAPEQAFALLGRGRCLVELARPSDAEPVLREAREIFDTIGAAPALAETDELLQRAIARTS
jgi:predicted ATPase/class 3 adenylate cyclase